MSQVFSFLIATDCHLGYEETDQIIGEDSFVTFEEILLKAIEEDVDLILLGGDLFHHNNPSQKCMNKCMELLRRYTLGDRPVYFELLCNASEVFSNSISQTTNYLDENINVSIPVFSIHGNHDDPSGVGQASALDTLSSAGLINYFGKWTDLEEVTIKPILLRKGSTRIALYGLSHIKDDRLCRLFLDRKIRFIRPEREPQEWFSIFVLHQNRVDRGPKRFISESYIPEFMDLVIWGHEHDCAVEPVLNVEKGFYVMQPGSSVPTSLSEGESREKHVAVLKVLGKKMKVKPLKLNTTRPFVWRSVRLWDVEVSTDSREQKSQEVKAHCLEVVEEMLREARKLLTGHPRQPQLPLVRLRCEYNDETQLFNVIKFGQELQGRVANGCGEVVRLKRSQGRRGVKQELSEDLARLSELYKGDMEEAVNFSTCVNHIVEDYFTKHESAKMLVLGVKEMGAAVERFIDKEDVFAIEESVDKRFERMMRELKRQKVNADEANLTEVFEQLREEEEKMVLDEEEHLQKKLDEVEARRKRGEGSGRSGTAAVAAEGDEDDDSDPDVFGRRAGNHSKPGVISDSGTDEYDVDNELETSQRGSKKAEDDFSDEDFDGLGAYRGRSGKSSAKEAGRGRGRGSRGGGSRGRGRARSESERSKSPRGSRATGRGGKTRASLKLASSIVFDDDSD